MNLKLRINLFLRSFFLQAGWNFAKYQNFGFAFIMLPVLRRIYKDEPETLSAVMQRYLDTFNTHPVMASFCFGALAKQEESVSRAHSVTEYKEQIMEWSGIRRGLSITVASIGDRLFWGVLKPLSLLLTILILMLIGVNFFETRVLYTIPLIYVLLAVGMAFVSYNIIALFVRWKGLQISYESNEKNCFGLTSFDWNRTIYNLKKLGFIFTALLIVLGVYLYFREMLPRDIYFLSRAILVLFFVILSFITRQLRIPNIYLYLASVLIFSLVCLF